MAEDRRLFGIMGDWNTAALDPEVWCSTVREEGCRFMAAWVVEEENASKHRQRKRAALIGPTQGLPKQRRLCQ